MLKSYNRQNLITCLESVGTPNNLIQSVLDLLDGTDFYEAPASTKYHGSEPGGLFDHSLSVAQLLISWTNKGLITWKNSWSPAIVGLLHDFTKADKYLRMIEEDGIVTAFHYDYNPNVFGYGGHGSDSLIKVLQKVPLSEEESLCIRYHMGAYEKEDWDGFDKAIRKYSTVLWTHHADMVASKVLGV